MRTAVIGTSNSLVRGGVVQGLIDGGINVIANASLGHSQAVILPFRLSPSELGSQVFDHLVVEIATNEQVALRSSLANFQTLRSVLDWTLEWCAERGIGVTLATMPELASYTRSGDLRAFGIRHFLNEYATQRRVSIHDGYEWLETWASAREVGPEECFETPAHMNADIAHALGVAIAATMDSSGVPSMARSTSTKPFRYVPLSATENWDAATTTTRSTSLGSADLLQLSADADFEVDLGLGSIVGIVHNVAGTNGMLQIDGLESGAKRLDGSLGEKLVLTAWGLRTPVRVDGQTTLRALPVNYQPELEHNHVSVWRPLHPRAKRRRPTLEIAGIILSS